MDDNDEYAELHGEDDYWDLSLEDRDVIDTAHMETSLVPGQPTE